MIYRHGTTPGAVAVRFFAVSALVLSMGGAVASVLIRQLGARASVGESAFPTVFWVSTVMVLVGSAALDRSLKAVRKERQGPFRRYLLATLLTGAMFLGVQSSGLWCLLENQSTEQVATGVNSFVTVLVALHAMHFSVALLFAGSGSGTSLLIVAVLVIVPGWPAVTVVTTTIASPLASVPRGHVKVLSILLQPNGCACRSSSDKDNMSPEITWVSTTSVAEIGPLLTTSIV